MKCTNLITAGLLAAGLISTASASSTAVIGGTTYTVVYISGSTAFRANVYTAVSTGLFDSNSFTTQPATGVSGSTGAYNIYGNIGGTPYLLSFDFTGSEAGLASLQNVAVVNNFTAPSLPGYTSSTVDLPGTPLPTGFINTTGSGTVSPAPQPDLAFSDTSKAVSLTAGSVNLTDYGIVAVIPFTWAKGYMKTPDSTWTDLVNISEPQVNLELSTVQIASFFTGKAADQDDVYVIGRNKGSGTRVNCMLDTLHGVTTAVSQYAPANSTYASSALTIGAIAPLSTMTNASNFGGLVSVQNDGFDSGSGVAKTLEYDLTGANDQYGQIITLGYLGVSDFTGTALPGGAVALTLNGVAESDGNIQNGTYSYWGHEHLYGTVGQSTTSPGGVIALKLAGSHKNEALGTAFIAGGSVLETSFGTGGGNEANPNATMSSALDPLTVHADKVGDTGYPSQQN